MTRATHILLASTGLLALSMAERSKGRLMRAPDEHAPAGGAPEAAATEEQAPATGNEVKDLGGALEVVAERPATEEPAAEDGALKLPEGYATAEEFAAAVLNGTYKAPVVEVDPESPEAKAAAVAEAVRVNTEGMAPEMATKVTPFIQAFAETGTLTDEQVKQAATDTGLSEPMIRQYMAGAEAETIKSNAAVSATIDRFAGALGGIPAYDAFQAWANDGGLSDAEAATFNGLLETNQDAAFALLDTYKARMEAQGQGPGPVDLTHGKAPGDAPGAIKGFASLAEQTKAINDPRYGRDPAYRAQVAKQIEASTY